ncbi:MAG TPA: Rrf2 family transcriptional regulator [Anaerolineae bacterium]|nr:Rrf2 family transcriptional regulator [Anaerolineae bacterium]MCB0181568.1 Rrf2 family transcriptional regulator [Anaerolineae bacterium]MCB0225497.1 Rrf2 family transcriptional regulator [Anaerolineae bacterium]MCB9107713.1 Rrf2 family transcriptional regulator [Anaerolineales bacterium]HRV96461.1 Rrf2 family transcriptional regulator [Anaerolineae bacterium]
MSINSRFAVAVHILALLALEGRPLSSKYIAGSVNTNPVVIRRILSLLSKAGFVDTQLGVEGGSTLARPAETITLLEVYNVSEQGQLFALHSNQPNPLCPCGRNIKPTLLTVFQKAEAALEGILAEATIADVVQDIEAQVQSQL